MGSDQTILLIFKWYHSKNSCFQVLKHCFQGQKHIYRVMLVHGIRNFHFPSAPPFCRAVPYVISTNPLLPTAILPVYLLSRTWLWDSKKTMVSLCWKGKGNVHKYTVIGHNLRFFCCIFSPQSTRKKLLFNSDPHALYGKTFLAILTDSKSVICNSV